MRQHISEPAPFDVECARFDEQLMAYLERELDALPRAWMEQHRASCGRCQALSSDIETISKGAATLPPLSPARDLWAGIESRLDTVVVPLHGSIDVTDDVREAPSVSRRGFRLRDLAIAATLLMAVSSAVTWRLARVTPAAAPTVALAGDSVDRMTVIPVVSADVTYEQEIAALRAVVNERFAELDSATVAVLRRNLAIIDRAIADSREALEKDPSSRVLSTTLDRALETKLSLMRRVALL